MHLLITIMSVATIIAAAPAPVAVAAIRIARRARFRRALKHVARSGDGRLYVRDPQTGAMHQLYMGLDGKFEVKRGELTRRQKKAVKRAGRRMREALR